MCTVGSLGTPLCLPNEWTPSIFLLKSLSIGTALSDLILVIKSSLICTFWLLTLRIHNDFSKNFASIVCLPITVEVIMHFMISLIEVIWYFPDMNLLETLYEIHEQLEVIIRRIFIFCLLLFIWLLILSVYQHLLSKRVYSISFMVAGLLATSYDITKYELAISNYSIEYITYYFNILIAALYGCSFMMAVPILLFKKSSSNDVKIRKDILGWTMSFICFMPLSLLDFYSTLHWDYVRCIQKLSPPFIILTILTCLPAYRSVLRFMICSPTFQTSQKILPEIVVEKPISNTRPIIIYPNEIEVDRSNMSLENANKNVMYSYLQDNQVIPKNSLIYHIKVVE